MPTTPPLTTPPLTTQPPKPGAPDPATAAPATGAAWIARTVDPRLDAWLTARRNAGATPAEITTALVASGWSADAAATASLRSLRRSDRHGLLYGTLCWSTGLAAVGFTTAAHQLLGATPDRPFAALALTVSVVATPIAAVTAVAARRTEHRSTHAVWSPSRRAWFAILATCTAVVGIVRLVTYVYAVIASLTAATTEPLLGVDLVQVVISLTVALPLFWWSFTEWRRSNVVISGLREERS